MVQDGVERAERAAAAVNETYRTGDVAHWRRFVAMAFDPEVVLEARGDAFTEGEWRGHEGLVAFVANQMEVLDDMWLRVDELIHETDDTSVVGVTFGGRARHTGLDITLHPVYVFSFRGGRAVRWTIFMKRDEALAAAGLPRG